MESKKKMLLKIKVYHVWKHAWECENFNKKSKQLQNVLKTFTRKNACDTRVNTRGSRWSEKQDMLLKIKVYHIWNTRENAKTKKSKKAQKTS